MDRAADPVSHTFAAHRASADVAHPERTAARIVAKVGEGRRWFGQVRMARGGPPWAWEIAVAVAADSAGVLTAFLDSVAEYALGVRFDWPRELPPPADALARRGRTISTAFMPNWWIFSSEALAVVGHAALVAFMRGSAPRPSDARPLCVGVSGTGEATYVAGAGDAGVFEMVRRLVRHSRPGAPAGRTCASTCASTCFTWACRCLSEMHGDVAAVEQKATAFETFRANPHVWGLLGESPAGCFVDIRSPVTVGDAAYTPFFHGPQGLVAWCVRADTQAVYWMMKSDDGATEVHPDGAADVEEFVARLYYESRAWLRAAAELCRRRR